MWIFNCKIFQNRSFHPGKVEISEETGKILQISHQTTVNNQIKSNGVDCHQLYLCPGMIDIHVHFRDLNQSYKETLETGTKAALQSGITTVLDMPNKVPVVDNYKLYSDLKSRSAFNLDIDIFNYMFLNDTSLNSFSPNLDQIFYWKVVFGGTTNVESAQYGILKNFGSKVTAPKVLVIHAEDPEIIAKNMKIYSMDVENHNLIRSIEAENFAIQSVLKIVNGQAFENISYHFAHITNKQALSLISASNKNISCEVTPHHLVLNSASISYLKNKGFVNPPLRDSHTQKQLLKRYKQGNIPIIGSDHAPHTLEDKLERKLSGFPNLDTIIPVLLSASIPLPLLIETYSNNPAKRMNLNDRGEIKEGNLADLALINPKLELKVTNDLIYSKAKWSPWDGEKLHGWVIKTWKRGREVFDREI